MGNEDLLAHGLENKPNLITAIMRSSAYNLCEKFGKAYIYADLAGVQVISMISPADFPISRGTQVYPTQTFGVVRPAGIGWGGYFQNLLDVAESLETGHNQLSAGQKAQIERALKRDPKRAASSEDARIGAKQHGILEKGLEEEEDQASNPA